jgi:hypothetical protein
LSTGNMAITIVVTSCQNRGSVIIAFTEAF